MEILQKLFYTDLGNTANNIAILIFRVLFAWELLTVHGLKKIQKGPQAEPEHIPNPLQLPEKLNAAVAQFADTIVPFFIALGLFGRLALLPTIGVTAVGYFVVHRHDSREVRDIPFMYTLCLLLLLLIGPGTYSIDHYIYQLLTK
ncbi:MULTISPECIES: DoxX family protein [Sphingobacterium]|jgi:putative oxidoreductase|uniref:DoxX family protein n=1 Tax=Sphingobacterium multivorum TaxID=28454 RepID=A0ABX7CK18_SPHMU|nr:DoxX family protein [Sphingobacterium multivorum]QQT32063.1 DoxX family protein [Sphingobacterium multivorum]QQT52018.1 DoxX family protein [Sphingobacterium multivorum]